MLEKLFVLVPAGVAFDGAAVSAGDNLIYFEQSKCTIWHKGIAYGMDPDKVKGLADVIALVGEKPETWADSDTVISRLVANETLAAKNENNISQIGMGLAGYGDAAISEEVAKQWGDFNEEGDFELDGRKSILGSISALEKEDRVSLAEGEKILALSDKNVLSSALSLAVNKHAESEEEGAAEREYIQLLGKDNVLVAEVDASAFVKDGMIDSVAWSTEEGKENVLVVTWNTEAGKSAVEVDMSKFIDTYTSGSEALNVNGYVISLNMGSVSEDNAFLVTGGQVYAAIEPVKEDIKEAKDDLSLLGYVLNGKGDKEASEAARGRYIKEDEEGNLEATGESLFQDVYTTWSNTHVHENKDALDTITSDGIESWDDAADKAHEHENKEELDNIETGDKAKWDACVSTVGDENDGLVHDVATLQDQMNEAGKILIGYNDARLTDERAAKWLTKDESGEWASNGKSALADIAITQETIANWDPWTSYNGANE